MVFVAAMTPGVMAIAWRAAAFMSGTVCPMQGRLDVLFFVAGSFLSNFPSIIDSSKEGQLLHEISCRIQARIALLCAQSPAASSDRFRSSRSVKTVLPWTETYEFNLKNRVFPRNSAKIDGKKNLQIKMHPVIGSFSIGGRCLSKAIIQFVSCVKK